MPLEFGSTEANKILKRDRKRELNGPRINEIQEELASYADLILETSDHIEHLTNELYGYKRQVSALNAELKRLT